MADDTNTAPEDLGDPTSYLVLADGTPVYDRSGDHVGTVAHVLKDEGADVFHGLVIKTGAGHRYAAADAVDGLFAKGVIVAHPAAELPEPSADPAAATATDTSLTDQLKRAWQWIIQPR
jgi:uncharacterized protein YrrD